MSSFLDSTGLSELAAKLKSYFCKQDGNYPTLISGGTSVTQIGSTNVDLNDFKGGTTVKYYMWSAGNAKNVANKPFYDASILVVYPQVGAAGHARQVCYRRGAHTIATRDFYDPEWTTWREIALDNGSYSNMTVGNALALDNLDQTDGAALYLLGYMNGDTSKRSRKAVNFYSYHDSPNGTIVVIGNSSGSGVTNRGMLRLASGNSHYTNIRTASAGDDRDTVIAMPVLGYDRVIPVYPSTGSGVGSTSNPVYVKADGSIAPTTKVTTGIAINANTSLPNGTYLENGAMVNVCNVTNAPISVSYDGSSVGTVDARKVGCFVWYNYAWHKHDFE